jgi:integrase
VVVSLGGLRHESTDGVGQRPSRHLLRSKKVPKGLEEAVARVLANGKSRQSWLKRSLGTKNLHEANIRGKPVLMEFDRILERARQLLKEQPTRTALTRIEITRMAEYHHATMLGNDTAVRRDFRQIVAQFPDEIPPSPNAPAYGLTDGELERLRRAHKEELKAAQAALARGNIAFVEGEVEELLNDVFHIRLDRTSPSYRALGAAVLAQHVNALIAIQRRHAGEAIETPPQPEPDSAGAEPTGTTLRAAFEGWKRERRPAPRTLMEYERAITLFAEIHGDMQVIAIKKSHARHYREALQQIPRHRTGKLLKAPLQDVVEWAKAHPTVPRLAPATVNKLIGGVQAVLIWAHDKGGFIPDDVPWADPFARMRLEEDKPEREPFDTSELQTLLRSPVFTDGERPKAGRGDAAYWLPLLALFTGCRRSELAGLTVADVAKDRARSAVMLTIIEDRESGKNLKTRNSQRVVPVHPQLRELGFLEFVEQRRADGCGDLLRRRSFQQSPRSPTPALIYRVCVQASAGRDHDGAVGIRRALAQAKERGVQLETQGGLRLLRWALRNETPGPKVTWRRCGLMPLRPLRPRVVQHGQPSRAVLCPWEPHGAREGQNQPASPGHFMKANGLL